MMLRYLLAVDAASTVLFHHTFTPLAPGVEAALDAALAAALPTLWPQAHASDSCSGYYGGHWVFAKETKGRDILLLLACDEGEEGDAPAELSHALAVMEAAVEGPLTPPRLKEHYGKAALCLAEAFYGGRRVYSDVELILRNAKLKALQT